MTIQLYYKTKKELKNNIGSQLDYSGFVLDTQ